MKMVLSSLYFIIPTSEVSSVTSFPPVAYTQDEAVDVVRGLNEKFFTREYFTAISFQDLEKIIMKNNYVEYIYGERID